MSAHIAVDAYCMIARDATPGGKALAARLLEPTDDGLVELSEDEFESMESGRVALYHINRGTYA